MSNLWINWRFWYWHLQIGPDRPWLSINFNSYRWINGYRTPWFERY